MNDASCDVLFQELYKKRGVQVIKSSLIKNLGADKLQQIQRATSKIREDNKYRVLFATL